MQLIKEDATCESIFAIRETSKLSLCRCISQGVIHVFFSTKRQAENPITDETIFKEKILDCLKRILKSLDLESIFEFLKSVLNLVATNPDYHDSEKCANYFLFEIFEQIHESIKSDRYVLYPYSTKLDLF